MFNEFEFDESKEGERKDIVSERKLPDLYFDEIKSYKSLTPEEERELGKKLLENDEDAREKFIEANLRLVISIAKRFCGRGLEFLDLVQAGNLGLMRAVDKFEWWRGYKFSTFATWWIRAAVTREIYNYAGTIRIPVHIREFWNKVLSVSAEIIQKKGREPRPEEIAREIGLETNKVSRILKAMHMSTVYLEDLFGSDDGEDENRSWEEVFDDKRAIIPEVYVRAKEEIAIILEELKKINVAISYLPPRDAEVVRLRYGIGINVSPQTLEQIGDLMGLTRERIRQIEEKSIKRLQAMGVIKVGEFVDELLERLNWAREIVPDIELDNLFRIDDAEAVNSILPIGEIQLAERVRRRRKNKKCIPKIILPKADEAENRVVKVIKDTAAAYGIPAGEILGKKRNAEIALARQVVMYILREDCRLSFSQIAKALNLKNHTTVMHGYERIKNELSRSRIEGGVRKN